MLGKIIPGTRMRRAGRVLVAACVAVLMSSGAVWPQEPDPRVVAAALFSVDPVSVEVGHFEGAPPVAEVRENGRPIGYLVSSWRAIRSVGYSGKPLDVWLAIDDEARVVGARLIAQQEPILVIGVSPEELKAYVAKFAGLELRLNVLGASDAPKAPLPDAVAGASISSAVIRDAIIRAGRAAAEAHGLLGPAFDRPRVDRASFAEAGWADLIGQGALASRRIDQAELARALSAPAPEKPDDLFIEIFTALATPPTIGQNLLGRGLYESLMAEIGPADNLLLIAARGLYSFKGTSYKRSGTFERIELRQAEKTIKLTAAGYRNVPHLAVDDAPELREIGVFIVPESSGFDPTSPWKLALMVAREALGGGMNVADFTVRYELPRRFVHGQPASAPPPDAVQPRLWQEIWASRIWEIALLGVMLLILAAILVFQDALARRLQLYHWVRRGFLAVTLVWLGWMAGAQLSVINVMTFAHALLTGFQWELFLLDPLVFILWSFVAVGLLFWGRGVFCGWLCPFGALQELLNIGAQRARIPQFHVPFGLHERLWPIKYILFLGLFAVSLKSVVWAFQGAEVEPFKTVITLKFWRAWPFVVYAAGLLIAGLFVQRFFCRYLCPLGAALAIPARLRMFEWLKRRVQCGRECRICAQRCPVQAIHPLGQINPNECIHCLNCQTLYYDSTTCPPLIARAARRAGGARHMAPTASGDARNA